ncbi:uncharacterized protein METZ01_LOCUS216591, partial [marine metagenome]
VNYFFGIKNSFLNSKLTIPRFQNSNPTKKEYMLFQLEIINQSWKISNLNNIDLNSDFYKIGSSLIGNGNIFCLATKAEILELEKNNYSKLVNFNNFTDTIPDYRANLQVSIEGGGFSSYQSDYPFSMVTKKGSILSALSSLCNKNADQNIIFFKNIYELPIQEEFCVFFVNIKTMKVLKKEVVSTNFLNEIIVEKEFIKPEVFLFTDKYIGIPIFCSIQDKHISFEHTHPPHEYIMNEDRFKLVSELKKEFSEIIN